MSTMDKSYYEESTSLIPSPPQHRSCGNRQQTAGGLCSNVSQLGKQKQIDGEYILAFHTSHSVCVAWYCGNLCSFQSNSSQCQEYISSAVNAKTRIFSRSQLLQRGRGEAAKTPIKLCQPLTFISKLHFSPCHQKYFYRVQKFGLSNVSIDHDFYLALFLLDRNRLPLPQSV